MSGGKLFFFSEIRGQGIVQMQQDKGRWTYKHPLDTSLVPDICAGDQTAGQSKNENITVALKDLTLVRIWKNHATKILEVGQGPRPSVKLQEELPPYSSLGNAQSLGPQEAQSKDFAWENLTWISS